MVRFPFHRDRYPSADQEHRLTNNTEKYLKERSSAKFDRDDFDCLSNKFLSKLVIRAN